TTSARTPATLRYRPSPATASSAGRSTSLGHFTTAPTPPSETARTTARPASSGGQPSAPAGTSGRSTTDTVSPARAGVSHVRPARARPAVWCSATRADGAGHAAGSSRTAATSSVLVEGEVSTTSTRPYPGTLRRSRDSEGCTAPSWPLHHDAALGGSP